MDGQWTYSYSEIEWVNDSFHSREEALEEAVNQDQQKVVWIGQLSSVDNNELEFLVTNIERMEYA
ncbi:hypothetical protein ACFVAD_20535 [Sutcliffiella sp. NPDC057660]|uniref:hypothetical protein n=1 Tax=Sutcliffiella sp. NPDC057660 TaxID=3346199 RepID=UPI003698CF7D